MKNENYLDFPFDFFLPSFSTQHFDEETTLNSKRSWLKKMETKQNNLNSNFITPPNPILLQIFLNIEIALTFPRLYTFSSKCLVKNKKKKIILFVEKKQNKAKQLKYK